MKMNLPDKLSLTEVKDEFWLYDKIRNMQHRLAQVEKEYKELNKKVNAFLEQFSEGRNNEDLD